jgi:hypothetical protein
MDYFDLNARPRPRAAAPSAELSIGEQLVMYLGTVIGVLGSSALAKYRESGAVAFDFNWAVLGITLFIALVIFPSVYKRADVDATAPFLVRFGLFVQNGVFWDALIGGLGQGTAGP